MEPSQAKKSVNPFLPIVLLASDVPVCFILFATNSSSFAGRYIPVSLGSAFCSPDVPLLGTKFRGFSTRQLTGCSSLPNSPALCLLAFINYRSALRNCLSRCSKQHQKNYNDDLVHISDVCALTSESCEGLINAQKPEQIVFAAETAQ
jgi:hypothetical protein